MKRIAPFLFALTLSGCALFGAVAPPTVDCTARVIVDAAKGMTIADIYNDVKGPCSLDIDQIISILLASKDPNVQRSAAYVEALKVRSAMKEAP